MNHRLRAPLALAAAFLAALAAGACDRAPTGAEVAPAPRFGILADSTTTPADRVAGDAGSTLEPVLADPATPPVSETRGGYGVGSGH